MWQADERIRLLLTKSVVLTLGLMALGLLVGELVEIFWGWKAGLFVGGIVSFFGQYRLTQVLLERRRNAQSTGQ